MAGAFLYQNRVTQSVGMSSAYATVTALPLSNLIDDQPRTRMRLVGVSSSGGFAASFVVDLLGQVTVECVALISTTLDSAASDVLVRARLATADATGATGDAWDSGSVLAQTGPAANGNVVLLRSAGAATGRYLLIDIGASASQRIDIGRLIAGPLFKPRYSHAYGIEEGREILDRRDRNALTGVEFPVPSIRNPRTARFTLPVLSSAEARGELRELTYQLGGAGEGLWIPDTTLSQSEINARSLWGAMAQPGAASTVAQQSLRSFSRSFSITERT